MKSSCHFRVSFVVSLFITFTNTQAFFYPQPQRYAYIPNQGCDCEKPAYRREIDEAHHGYTEQLSKIYEQLQQLATERPNHESLSIATKEEFFAANVKKFEVKEVDPQKALACANLQCPSDAHEGTVCACNHLTGKVASFRNSCDLTKHNCRFDTEFKVILNEICPWEFQSRRSNGNIEESLDYEDPKYYN